MRRNSKLFTMFIYLSLIILGIVIGIAVAHYNKLPLAQEVNIIDIAALVVTVFLAVYVPAVLDRRLQTLRDLKDLLEDHISDYQASIRRINMLVQENRQLPAERDLILRNALDIAGHRLDTIRSLIGYSGLDDSLKRDISAIKKIDNEHSELLSGTIGQDGYTDAVRQQEEVLYNKLDEATSLLMLKINATDGKRRYGGRHLI